MAQAEPMKDRSAITTSVNKAISEWERSTTVAVTPPAKEMVMRQFSDLPSKRASPETAPLLTKAYLYELRDSKPLGGQAVKLDSTDISRYPLTFFASQSAFDKGMGYLRCSSSDPKGGKITIDGESKGQTVKTFALSIGTHRVAIALEKQICEESVVIEEHRQIESSCPKTKK